MKLLMPLRTDAQLLTTYALFDTLFWGHNDSALQGTHKALFPFLVSALKRTDGDVVTLDAVAEGLESILGLKFPQQVLRGMLRTAYREKLLTRSTEDGVTFFSLDRAALANQPDVEQAAEALRRDHGILVREFRNFSRVHFERPLTRVDAETALQTLLLERIDRISTIEDYTSVAFEWSAEMSSTDAGYILRRFIEEEVRPGSDLHAYMNRIVKGSALAVSIFFRGDQVDRLAKSMRGLRVCFDTPLLLSLLGYHTDEDRAAAADLLQLVKASGARPCVFDHTCNELRNVLYGAVQDMRDATHGQALDSTMPVVERFVQRTLNDPENAPNRARFIIEAERIRSTLEDDFNFRILARRGRDDETDEAQLKQLLEDQYDADPTRRLYDFDVRSLLELRHIRRERTFHTLADARAILVTTNPRLVASADLYFGTNLADNEIPYCYTSSALANLLWLKRPLDMPSAPWRQIVSYAYAGLYPGDELWSRYTTLLDGMRHNHKSISDDEYFILRFTVGARQALMDDTLGDPDLLTLGRISDILNEAQARLNNQLKEQVEEQEAALTSAAELMQHLEDSVIEAGRLSDNISAEVVELRNNAPLERLSGAFYKIEADGRTFARRVRGVVESLVILWIIAGFLLTATSAIGGGLVPMPAALGVAFIGMIVSGFGFLNIRDGWTFAELENRVAYWHTRRSTDKFIRRLDDLTGDA